MKLELELSFFYILFYSHDILLLFLLVSHDFICTELRKENKQLFNGLSILLIYVLQRKEENSLQRRDPRPSIPFLCVVGRYTL